MYQAPPGHSSRSWINGGYHDAVYAEAFRVLKPGGVMGVVQHRAQEGDDPVASAKTGYVPEAFVIEAARRAGFELAGRSEVNANPKDTKDHPEGVWTLPPKPIASATWTARSTRRSARATG